MRRIGTVTSYALVMVFTLLMLRVPRCLTSPPLTSLGLRPPCHVVSTLRVTSLASTVSGRPFVASCSTRASSPTLKSLEPQPLGPAASTLRVTSLASTLPGEHSWLPVCRGQLHHHRCPRRLIHPALGINPRVTSLASTRLGASIMASCFTRALSPPLMSMAPPLPGPSGSTLRVTSLASTRLGAPLMGSCLTSMAASRRLTSLGPHPPSPWVSTLGVTSLARDRLGPPLMGSCVTRKAASRVLTSLGPHPPRPRVSILGVT